MLHSKWAEELHVTPARAFTSIELFAGGGGLALGMEKAGFKHVLLNEFDPYACQTLRTNRPEWNVVEGDVAELGYTLVEPRVLKAVMYQVPQKRERLILVAIRNDYADKVHFEWPSPYGRVMTLRDAFCAGELYATDVPPSPGQKYPQGKREVMEMVPRGVTGETCPRKYKNRQNGATRRKHVPSPCANTPAYRPSPTNGNLQAPCPPSTSK